MKTWWKTQMKLRAISKFSLIKKILTLEKKKIRLVFRYFILDLQNVDGITLLRFDYHFIGKLAKAERSEQLRYFQGRHLFLTQLVAAWMQT